MKNLKKLGKNLSRFQQKGIIGGKSGYELGCFQAGGCWDGSKCILPSTEEIISGPPGGNGCR